MELINESGFEIRSGVLVVVVEVVEFSKFAKKKRPHLFRSISEDASGVSAVIGQFRNDAKKSHFRIFGANSAK